jgi:hypothetical protein
MLGAEAEADLLASNNGRREAFATYAQGHLDAFNADVDAQVAKVETWFGDRLDWVDKLYDSQYKGHLVAQLETKRDESLASLQARADTCQALVDSANDTLDMNLAGDEEALWQSHADAS